MTFNKKQTRSLLNFLKSDFGLALIISLSYQLIILILSLLLRTDESPALLAHMSHWDGGWYQYIINTGYSESDAAPAFYPLFPVLVILIKTLTLNTINTLTAGFILNIVSMSFALTALVKISDHFVSIKHRWWIIALFLASPAAIFMHMFYTEALFCAIGFWAYLYALRKKWKHVGVLLAILTAIRLPSLLFVALCFMEYIKSHNWNTKKLLNKNILWFLLSPLGVIVYSIYLFIVKGDALAMIHTVSKTNEWSYHIFNPNIFITIARQISAAVKTAIGVIPLNDSQIVNNIIPIVGLLILALTSLYAIRSKQSKKLALLGVFGFLSIILFTLNSNIVSVHRYLLPVITIYIISVVMLEKYNKLKPFVYSYLVFSVLLQLYLLNLFVNTQFAG